jgi:hypothetical protein
VKSLVKSEVLSARSGLTTNWSDVLSTRCRLSAERYIISHDILNGSCESCGAIVQTASGQWRCQLYGVQTDFDLLEDCVRALGSYLVRVHVPAMATNASYTEFGVGVAKYTSNPTYYFIYISCASPDELQYQIEQGWYD